MEKLNNIFAEEDYKFLELILENLSEWKKIKKIDAPWLVSHFSKLKLSHSAFMGVEELSPLKRAKKPIQLPRGTVSITESIDDRSLKTEYNQHYYRLY